MTVFESTRSAPHHWINSETIVGRAEGIIDLRLAMLGKRYAGAILRGSL